MPEIFEILLVILLIGGVFYFGWIGNDIYRGYTNKRLYDGLWIPARDKISAMEKAYSMDDLGQWVCVNIKGMEYKRAVETCQHEVGHEMFAGICEKNMSKCYEVLKNEEK